MIETEKTKPNEQTWIFTFGFNHGHDKCYTMYFGTYTSAREKMVRDFDSKWSFQYPSKKLAGVDYYNLKFITKEKQDDKASA